MSGIDHLTYTSKEQSTKPSGDPCFVMTKSDYKLQSESGDLVLHSALSWRCSLNHHPAMSLIPKNLALTVIIHYLHNQTLYQDNTVLKFCGTGGKNRA